MTLYGGKRETRQGSWDECGICVKKATSRNLAVIILVLSTDLTLLTILLTLMLLIPTFNTTDPAKLLPFATENTQQNNICTILHSLVHSKNLIAAHLLRSEWKGKPTGMQTNLDNSGQNTG